MKSLYLFTGMIVLLCCPAAQSQASKNFPTDDEIRLLVTQTDRALTDYSAASKQYQGLEETEADAANDKRVIDGLTTMAKGFDAKPQAFNSRFGFEFVLLLDDASRNASLCYGDAIAKGIKATMAHNTQIAQDYLQLAQSCTSVSTLLYTISENAAALYRRYLDGADALSRQATAELNRCAETLKKQTEKDK